MKKTIRTVSIEPNQNTIPEVVLCNKKIIAEIKEKKLFFKKFLAKKNNKQAFTI